MAVNKHEFWQRVTEIDSHEKLRALKLRQLREYQRYFVEVQYEELEPADEKAAPIHLTRLQHEIDRRSHSWTQRLAGTGIALTAIGVVRCRADIQSANSQSRTSAALPTTPSMPTQHPTQTQQPTPTQEPNANAAYNLSDTERDAHASTANANTPITTISTQALISIFLNSPVCSCVSITLPASSQTRITASGKNALSLFIGPRLTLRSP